MEELESEGDSECYDGGGDGRKVPRKLSYLVGLTHPPPSSLPRFRCRQSPSPPPGGLAGDANELVVV